jgi:hypothetical protein
MVERLRRSISVLCGAAALAIAASACASSGTSSSVAGAAGNSLTGPPITLLSINILSGPTSTEPEIPIATQAAVNAIN